MTLRTTICIDYAEHRRTWVHIQVAAFFDLLCQELDTGNDPDFNWDVATDTVKEEV
jgi:hypothetical protein